MSYEEDYVNEEDEFEEGSCDDCHEHIIGPGLTKCPESCEDIKASCWVNHSFCRDCCKNALDNRDCEGSCGEDFVEEYRKSRFTEICNTEKLIKYDEESYTNAEKSILITIGKIEDKFEKNPIEITPDDSSFAGNIYFLVKHGEEIHNFRREYYDLLVNLLDKFNENYLTYFLQGDKKIRILKLKGDYVSGLIFPIIDEVSEFESETIFIKEKNEFLKYLTEGINFFNIEKEIDKYCSVIQDNCTFKIKYRGKDSYFLAYPFKPKKWPSFMKQLKTELINKRIDVVCPVDKDEDFPETGILFCKLCKMICSTNSIICEITEINQNVMFEAGYALGLGKYCHLLIDRNYDPSQRNSLDLIEDLQQKRYLDPQTCSNEFKLKEEDIYHLLPIRPPKITNSCCKKDINYIKSSVFLLIPDDEYHLKVVKPKVESLLKNRKINNAEKILGHDLCNHCKAIQESEFVIGDFVSDTSIKKEEKNSKISFLLGFSLAKGKKVILLQQEPAHKKIIDFGKMTKLYTNADQIQIPASEIL